MKFKHQEIITCAIGLVLGLISPLIKAEELPPLMVETPVILCVKNKVYAVWEKYNLAPESGKIFCTYKEDLVEKPSEEKKQVSVQVDRVL